MLEEVKHNLRIDRSEDDGFLTSLIEAAKQYIKNATGKVPTEQAELDKLAIILLVTHWYENRDQLQGDKQSIDAPYSLTFILTQLQYVEEVEDET